MPLEIRGDLPNIRLILETVELTDSALGLREPEHLPFTIERCRQ